MSRMEHLTRSARRALSRDQVRKGARIGTTGERVGGWPAVIDWKKHVPVVPARSGQVRVDHKRNQRIAFWERFKETN